MKTPRQLISVLVSCCCVSFIGVGTNTYSDTPTAIRFAYPSVYLDGTYAKQLAVDDVRQIRSRSDILKPVGRVVANLPNEADVDSGSSRTGHVMTRFKVRKENGWWMIIKGSVETGEVIITS